MLKEGHSPHSSLQASSSGWCWGFLHLRAAQGNTAPVSPSMPPPRADPGLPAGSREHMEPPCHVLVHALAGSQTCGTRPSLRSWPHSQPCQHSGLSRTATLGTLEWHSREGGWAAARDERVVPLFGAFLGPVPHGCSCPFLAGGLPPRWPDLVLPALRSLGGSNRGARARAARGAAGAAARQPLSSAGIWPQGYWQDGVPWGGRWEQGHPGPRTTADPPATAVLQLLLWLMLKPGRRQRVLQLPQPLCRGLRAPGLFFLLEQDLPVPCG